MNSKKNENKPQSMPPANALRVTAWKDLHAEKAPARYRNTDQNGDEHVITLSKNRRRVLCLIPRFEGAIHSPEWKEALWDRYVTAAPRPRSPSELQYSDRKLRPRR